MDYSLYIYIGFGVAYFMVIKKYIQIATYKNIYAVQSVRSSHKGNVITGAGVIFMIASLTAMFFDPEIDARFYACLILISILSFIDDLISLSAKLRLGIQFLLSGVVIFNMHPDPFLLFPLCFIFVTMLNIYNFMDGINGMLGVNILISVSTLLFDNKMENDYILNQLLIYVLIATIVFLYFNFRVRAKCFAGDVGSITVGFMIIGILFHKIILSENYFWLLLFFAFMVDGGSVVLLRLFNRENIMTAHRKHFFQYLTNELKFDHRLVSIGYGAVQIVVNVIFLIFLKDKGGLNTLWLTLTIYSVCTISLVFIRAWIHGFPLMLKK